MAFRPEFYQLPKTFLNSRVALGLIVLQVVFGMAGFMWLEGYTIREAFYMVVITISTVGYGEVRQLSPEGQLFAAISIIFNIGIFAYVLSVFSYNIASGDVFKKMHFLVIGKKIKQLKNHVIICGYGKYGQEVCQHFIREGTPFVIVEKEHSVIEKIQQAKQKLLYIEGDATDDDTLIAAGIKDAKALIASLPDDSENLFIVLTGRQLNQEINIISRITEARSMRKLELAGADHVVMPEQIGGFYMATLVSKPGATEFFTYMTRELESDIAYEEISYHDMPSACRGMAIKDLNIRSITGTNIIAWRPHDGQYIVNPPPDTILKENSSFIVLGNHEQLKALKKYLNDMA